jgi:hypothetical protein
MRLYTENRFGVFKRKNPGFGVIDKLTKGDIA